MFNRFKMCKTSITGMWVLSSTADTEKGENGVMMQEQKPTHRQHNRWHDYSEKCIYHITLVVKDRKPLLGNLVEVKDGDSATVCPWGHQTKDKEYYGKAWMNLTPLGMDIARCIHDIPEYGKKKDLQLRILAQQVMDTHLHFVLYVERDMGDAVLGDIIRGLKIGCNKAYRKHIANGDGTPTGGGLFEEDYDETILTRRGQLNRMIEYVHLNPYRKWTKINNRDSFIPVRGIEIAGRRYDAIGNLMLLGLKRFQVHCRYKWERDHDIESRRAHQNECVVKARNNYALVSPFIMDHERDVMIYCLKEGHSVIRLMDNGFSDYTTCPGGLFEYCERGQVLLLVPSEQPHIDRKNTISRSECMALNALAGEIVSENSRS